MSHAGMVSRLSLKWNVQCPAFRRTMAWWIKVLMSFSLVAPSLLVFRRTRATCASSVPTRGSCKGFPSSRSCWFPCRATNKSSKGSGNVSAFPRAPNRCRAMWALAFKGSAAWASCFALLLYRASMVMQSKVVTHGLAQMASMTVIFCSTRLRGT